MFCFLRNSVYGLFFCKLKEEKENPKNCCALLAIFLTDLLFYHGADLR